MALCVMLRYYISFVFDLYEGIEMVPYEVSGWHTLTLVDVNCKRR